MKQVHFQETYPITVFDINKSETRFASAEHMADVFCFGQSLRNQ